MRASGLGFLDARLYIRLMRGGRKRERRVATWEVSRLKASPAAFIGLIDAPDEASAIKAAIKQFTIRPQDQKRLIAVRHQ